MKYRMFLVGFLIMLLLALNVSGAAVDDAIGGWSMNNADLSGSVMADCVGSNDLDLINTPTTGVSCFDGECILLDDAADEHMSTQANIGISGTNPQSLSCWINPDAAGINQYWASSGATGGTNLRGMEILATNEFKTQVIAAGIEHGTEIALDSWQNVVWTYDGSKMYFFVNTTAGTQNQPFTIALTTTNSKLFIGGLLTDVSTKTFSGLVKECMFWDRNITRNEIVEIYNGGTPLTCGLESIIISSEIKAKNNRTNKDLTNFTINIFNSTFSNTTTTTTGGITYFNIGGLMNITVFSNESGNYFNNTFQAILNGSTITARINKMFEIFNIDYENLVESNGINYTRNLTYTINFTCPSPQDTQIIRLINNTVNNVSVINCNSQIISLTGDFQNPTESLFNVTLNLNTSFNPEINNINTPPKVLQSDLFNPIILELNFTVNNSFSFFSTNVTLTCSDNVFPDNLTYNKTFNGIPLFFGELTNGTRQSNLSIRIQGDNILFGSCADPFGITTRLVNSSIFSATIILIDEIDNTPFNLDNITDARLLLDNNQTFFSFKDNNANGLNFSSLSDPKIRIELTYVDGTIINRYIDISLLNGDIRVCVNKEDVNNDGGVAEVQQIVISATQQVAILKNIFSDCIVAADFTRFAFQDAFALQAFTIPALYSLDTLIDNRQVTLASVDGSISTFINLDNLKLAQTPFNLNILGEAISFKKTASTQITILYKNQLNDNADLTTTITRMDLNELVFTKSDFSNTNEATLIFNFGTLQNITNETLFVLQVDTVKSNGDTNSFKRYFNTQAASGLLNSKFAFVFSFLLMIFGLTFTVVRITFGWFGIFMTLFAIGTLSFAIIGTFGLILMAMETIILIYQFILLSVKNHRTLA